MTDWMPGESIIEADNVVKIKDLKQEAINWIKNIDNNEKFGEVNNRQLERERYLECKESIIDWIKYFFNITDKELK